MLVFYATLGEAAQKWALVIVTVLGLALTIMWMMVNKRQAVDVETAVGRLETYCPEYAAYKEEREAKRAFRSADLQIRSLWALSCQSSSRSSGCLY